MLFDLERMNELQVYFVYDPPEVSGFRMILVTAPEHPYMERWWPPGHIIGYEHTFVHTVKDLLEGIAVQRAPCARPARTDAARKAPLRGLNGSEKVCNLGTARATLSPRGSTGGSLRK